MRLSANQLRKVLSQLPGPGIVFTNYYRIPIDDPPTYITTLSGAVKKQRFIEFEKSEDGLEWLLASMPEY